MTTAGVTTAQGNTTSNPFRPKQAVWALGSSGLTMGAAAKAGTAISLDTTAGYPNLKVSAGADTQIAGILGESFYDPSTLPADVKGLVYASNILKNKTIGTAATIYKIGYFTLIAVTGSVAYGDYVGPDTATAGNWKSYGATNPLKNGSMVCINPNGVAGDPIEVVINIA